MFTCPKCHSNIEIVLSKKCPYCKLSLFHEAVTTWIGSNIECNIIINREDIPDFAAVITYNIENSSYELVNMDENSNGIITNRKVVHKKEIISISDWVKISNIIFDFNHPKIAPIFDQNVKINLTIDFDEIEEYLIGNSDQAQILLGELKKEQIYASILKCKGNFFCRYYSNPEEPNRDSIPIFINGFKLFDGDLKLIDENDSIFIEDIKLDLSNIPNFINGSEKYIVTEKFPQTFIFEDFGHDTISIGQSNCDIVLVSEKISYKHIELRKFGNGNFWVKDCDSFFGTYLDNKKIQESEIGFDQPLIFGDFILTLKEKESKSLIIIEHIKGKIKLNAININKSIKNFRLINSSKQTSIINNVSLSVGAGEFVGIMGPSGAGKSTLLRILAGIDKINADTITGEVYYNDIPISKYPLHFKYSTAYLPQDDILFPDLTVYQCLSYSAKLRLPHLTKKNIDLIIDNVLISLDLAELDDDGVYSFPIKNKKIGDINKHGALSGGQRKRINLAIELMSDPSILFLDEPTSGLSSTDSEKLINLLTKISNVGNTIFITIHQPSSKIFNKFHKIMILNRKGEVAYFGSVKRSIDYFESRSKMKFDPKQNPANFIMDALDSKSPEFWKEAYIQSESHEFYILHPHQNLFSSLSKLPIKVKKPIQENVPDISQIKTLIFRNFKLKFNNLLTLFILILQAPLIAMFLGMIFSGMMQDGSRFSDMKPEEEFVRLENYSRPTTAKYLPPFNKDIRIENTTSQKLFLYSQSMKSGSSDTNYYKLIGPYSISKQELESGDGVYYPITSGNYKLIISGFELSSDKLTDFMKLSVDHNSNSAYYVLDYQTSRIPVNDWSNIPDSQKVKLWQEKILVDRKMKSFEDDSLFNDFHLFSKSSSLSFINPLFDNIHFFNQIKKYFYTINNQKYSWYETTYNKKVIFTGNSGYKEGVQKLLYLMFIMVIAFIWIGMTNSVKDIVLERAVFIRESRYTLKLLNYISSKFISLLIISILQIVAFLYVLSLFIPMPPVDIFYLCLILLLTSMIAGGIGLCISALAQNIEFAISFLPIILIPQIVFAGIFKHIGSMNSFIRSIADTTISRWSLESLVNLISKSVDFESPFNNFIVPYSNVIYPCYSPTFDQFGNKIQHGYFPYVLEMDLLILFAFFCMTFIFSLSILKIKAKYFRK